MGQILAWDPLIILPLLVVIFLPGTLCLLVIRVRLFVAIAAGPAITFAMVGVGAIAADYLGLKWGIGIFAMLSLLAILLFFLLRQLAIPKGTPNLPSEGQAINVKFKWLVIVAVFIGACSHVLPVLGRTDPAFPSQLPDQLYHYNGLNAVFETGNSSTFSAMDPNYGFRISGITYPTVWHALASLVGGPSQIIEINHSLAYVVIPIMWVYGLACLAFAAFPKYPAAAVIAPLFSAVFPVFPLYITVVKGFWPNALSLSAVPGFLALALFIFQMHRQSSSRYLKLVPISLIVLGTGFIGLIFAHPSIAFTLGWVFLPVAIWFGGSVSRSLLNGPRRRLAIPVLGVVAVLIVVMLILVFSHDTVTSYMARETFTSWQDYGPRFVTMSLLWPLGGSIPSMVLGTVGYVVIALGIVLVWKNRNTRWIALGWVMQELLILGSYFPIFPFEPFAGLWYSDTYRLLAVQVIFTLLLITRVVIESLEKLASRNSGRSLNLHYPQLSLVSSLSVLSIGLVLTAGSWIMRNGPIYGALNVGPNEDHIVGSEEEYKLLQSLDEKVPSDSLIIGDPLSGAALAPILGNVNSVYTQINIRDWDYDGGYIIDHFDEIDYNPRVCQILNHYGVTHFYESPSFNFRGTDREDALPGFYEVDTSEGFTQVASAGDATLWRIDECGDKDPEGDWWSLDWRRDPLFDPNWELGHVSRGESLYEIR